MTKWTKPAAGLVAAGFVAWLACPAPPSHPLSIESLLARSIAYVILTFVSAAAAMFASARTGDMILRASTNAAWLAPIAIFLFERSAWAIAAVTVLIASMATLYPREVLPPSFPIAFVASFSLQSGMVAALDERPLAAVALLGIGAAIVTWRLSTTGGGRNQTLRTLVMLTLAIALCAAALTRYLPLASGSAGDGAARRSGDANVPGQSDNATGLGTGGTYRGVILWPEAQPHSVLVPPLPMMGRGLSNIKNPLSVPFYGVYWFYQRPDRQPPKNSYTTHGSPAAMTFRSANLVPLTMEARQNFLTLIDFNRFSAIQIVIENADRSPSPIYLELVLVNTRLAGEPSQTLALALVKSMPHDDGSPVQETLTFRMPPAPVITQFDEAVVRFNRGGRQAARSAKIAIDRFVLVPR